MLKIGDRVRCIDSAGSRWLRERPNVVFVVVEVREEPNDFLDNPGTVQVIVEGDPANKSNRLFMRRFVVIEEEKGLKVGDCVRYLKQGKLLQKGQLVIITNVGAMGAKVRQPGAKKNIPYWFSTDSFQKVVGKAGHNLQFVAVAKEPPKKLAVQWEPGVDNMPADQVPAILKELKNDFEAGQHIGTCSYLIEYREGGFKKQYHDVCHARIPTPRAKNVALRVKEHAKSMLLGGDVVGMNWNENEAIQYVKDWTSYIITESPVRDVFVKTTIDDAMEYGLLMNNKYHERVVSMAAIMWRVGVEHRGFIETWKEMRQRGYSGAVAHLTAHFCYKSNGVYTPFTPAGWHNSMESQMDFDELMDRFSGRNLVFNMDPPLHINGNPGGRINVNLAKEAKQRENRIINKIVGLFPANQVERPGYGDPYLKKIDLRDVVKIATFFKETLYGGDAAKAILAFDEIDR